MATFASIDNVVNQLTTNETGQTIYFEKFTQQSSFVSNVPQSFWPIGPNPIVGTYGTHGVANGRVCTVSNTGAMKYVNAAGGTTNVLSYFAIYSNNPGTFILVDRISDVLVTSGDSGTITGVDATSRLAASTGARILWENANLADGHQNSPSVSPTITYTNQAGVSHTTPTFTPRTATNAQQGEFLDKVWVPLASNDTGARTITSLSLAFSDLCAICLVRPLASLTVPASNTWVERDMFLDCAAQPIIYDSSCLQILFLPGSTSSSVWFWGMLRLVAK